MGMTMMLNIYFFEFKYEYVDLSVCAYVVEKWNCSLCRKRWVLTVSRPKKEKNSYTAHLVLVVFFA